MQFKSVLYSLPNAAAWLSGTRGWNIRPRSLRASQLRIDTNMLREPSRSLAICQNRSQRLERHWQELCARYLPLAQADSIWRYHRVRAPEEPTQGWKLHLSATVLNAGKVLARVAPFLAARAVQFKAPGSLQELIRINSGLFYGYSQVGKIITVYPGSPEEAVSLAAQLHKLTRRLAGPAVPFDLRFSAAGNVYYRFGAFKQLEMEHRNGQHTLAIQAPNGELVPDVRTAEQGRPDWVSDPFDAQRARRQRLKAQSPLAKNFRVFRALVQRGKGGVYQAFDLSSTPPRLCLLKEGRKNGELTWDGRDGVWRVRNEERVLVRLLAAGVAVPRVYSSFELEGNYYLVTEFIAGECLHNLLARLKTRISVARVLRYGLQLATIFSQIHAAGWVWRDCKPTNIIVTPGGDLRPLDFEGACPVDSPDPMLWGTPGFTPPEWRELNLKTGLPHDLYAIGSMLYLLLTGQVPATTDPLPIERLRRHVPPGIRALVMRLLSHDLAQRPAAETVAQKLKAALSPSNHSYPVRQRMVL
jgi:hypothetical protein